MATSTLDDTALPERIARLFPLFRAGGTQLAQRIATLGQHRRVPAGTVMFSQHTPCGGFPLILSGSVKVLQRYPNGRELQLYRVRPGESCLLSGSCLLSDAHYDATGIAETAVELVVLPPAVFHRLLAEEDAFRRHVFTSFGTRLADVMQMVEAVAYQRLDQRLAKLLLERADAHGVVKVTHQALADGLGSVREMVSRLLSNFEDRQWVKLGRERVTIVDRAALVELAAA